MPVVIKYVVERNGVEKMTFSSKAEADQYDKLLETAENLEDLLESSGIINDPKVTADLAMFLAENKDDLSAVLNNKKTKQMKTREKSKSQESQPTLAQSHKKAQADLEDLIIEPDEDSYVSAADDDFSTVNDDDYSTDDLYADSDAA